VSFLIDENLSIRLKRLLEPVFPRCCHVADFGLLTANDPIIHAKALQRT
jgi:predicted nuclease of predicted toxin-antitoxin system